MDEQLPSVNVVWDQAKDWVNVENPLRKVGRKVNREVMLQDAEGVYYAIGGFQRFVHTADNDPKLFYNRYVTPGVLLAQDRQEFDFTVHIHPALQRSPLDGEYTEVADGQLDKGSDQASGSTTQSLGRSGGREDTTEQNEAGRALQFSKDQENGGTRAYLEENASLIEAMRSK